MDSVDQKIIEELNKNARKSFSAISKKLGVSTNTVIRKYNDMKENGTISLFAIRVNLGKIGYIGTAHMFIKTKPHAKQSRIINRLSKTPNIIIAVSTFGKYESYAVLAFRNLSELTETLVKIRELPDILNIEVSIGVPGIEHFPPKLHKLANKKSLHPKDNFK